MNTTLTIDNTDKVIQLNEQKHILFLIDIPRQNISGETRLMYLPESSRHSILSDWSTPIELEDSTFWKQLHDNFVDHIGKVRLFCHPEIASVINAAISHEKIVNIIDGALRFIQK